MNKIKEKEKIINECKEFFPDTKEKISKIGLILTGSFIIVIILMLIIFSFEEANLFMLEFSIIGMSWTHSLIFIIIAFTLGIFIGLSIFLYILFKIKKNKCINNYKQNEK